METFEERQERENKQHYEKWLSCGFTGEMELNEHGWFNKCYTLPNVKKMEVFRKGYQYHAEVEYAQLPNGKWVNGSSLWCTTHGYGHGASIWSKQYDTQEEAILAELNYIEGQLEEKDKKQKFILNGIQNLRNTYRKPSFEVAFSPTARFEQVALF